MQIDRRRLLQAAAAAPCLAATGTARARSGAILLGTATPGGGFPVYGAALIAALKSVESDLEIEARGTTGSIENISLLGRGELDLGLVTGEVLHEALAGIGGPVSRVTVLSAMYSQPGLFVVRADSPARTIEDLRGRPVAFGARGSGLVVLARYVLDGIGLDLDRDFQAIVLDRAGDGPAMVLDGRAAALWGGGLARALHRAEPILATALPQAAETTSANTVAAIARPESLHRGAARYLREAGLLP
jgi:TRAP transporter TAXI family solute receptor